MLLGLIKDTCFTFYKHAINIKKSNKSINENNINTKKLLSVQN